MVVVIGLAVATVRHAVAARHAVATARHVVAAARLVVASRLQIIDKRVEVDDGRTTDDDVAPKVFVYHVNWDQYNKTFLLHSINQILARCVKTIQTPMLTLQGKLGPISKVKKTR